VYYYDQYDPDEYRDDYYDDRYYGDGYYDDDVIYVDNNPYDNGYGWRMADNGYTSWQDAYDRRQDKKNEWRNIAYLSAAVLAYGLLKDDDNLAIAGGVGTLYSIYRYEEDRKSQNTLKRQRAEFYSRDYFYRDGIRYDRRLVTRDGTKYYQFVRL
jgi:hypothetical protein